MSARPINLTPAELRAEADRLEEAAEHHREAIAERDARRREAAAQCEEAAEAFRAELDAVLGEVRAALPGCEQWWPRIAAAMREYDVASAPARAVNRAVGSRWAPGVVLGQHPLQGMGELLRMLQER